MNHHFPTIKAAEHLRPVMSWIKTRHSEGRPRRYRHLGALAFVCAVLVILLALLSATFLQRAPAPANAQAADEARPALDRRAFAAPPQSMRPGVRWWWPGGDVRDSELARELQLMHDAGFGSAEIQSFAVGLPPDASPEVFTYGSPRWFDHVAFALNEAQRLGMKIDLTLGSAWPSGGAHIQDAQSLKQLTMSTLVVHSPQTQNLVVPGPVEPTSYFLANTLLKLPNTYDATKMSRVAVTAVKLAADQTPQGAPVKSTLPGLPDLPATIYLEPSSTVDLSAAVTSDGQINWTVPAGSWMICAFYEGPTGSRPFYGADLGGGLVLDHIKQEAINTHLQAIGETAKTRFGDHFGKTLRSLFVDSLELRTELYWTEHLRDEFYKRRGYHLEPFLPILFKSFSHDAYLSKLYPQAPPSFEMRDIGPRIRHDYEQTVSDLMLEQFFIPVQQWAESQALQTRVQAHGGPADLLSAYGHASIPETEGLYAGGHPAFLKMASSAAHLYGKPIVSSEILAFRLPEQPTTPQAMLREANKHLAAGVNHFVLHGFPYLYETGFARPGWMPFDSPYLPGREVIGRFGTHLNDRHLFWRFLPSLNDYLARAQMIAQVGQPVVDVALYTSQLEYKDDPRFDPPVNRQLQQHGYDYDYVNAPALLNGASVVDRKLHIGANRYQALILSDMRRMSLPLAQLIAEFAQQGLPVVFVGDIPYEGPGYLQFAQHDATVASIFEQLLGTSRHDARAGKKVSASSALYLSDVNDLAAALREDLHISPEILLSNGQEFIHYAHRRAGASDFYLLHNSSDAPLDAPVSFPNESGRQPEIWDLHTGQVSEAVVYESREGRTRVQLHFEPGSAVVVGFERPASTLHLEATNFPSVRRGTDGTLTGIAAAPGTYTVIYDGGIEDRVTINGPALPPIGLPTWDLIAISENAQGEQSPQVLDKFSLRDLLTVPELQSLQGTARYTAYIDIEKANPAYLSSDVNLTLDLGTVHDVAEVRINNEVLRATLTAPPYHVDITDYVTSGLNRIEVVTTGHPQSSPLGMIGPVWITPLYRVRLAGPPTFSTSVVITPAHFPDNTSQDMLDAIGRSAELVNHVNFQWFWKTPPNAANPQGGAVVDCDSAALWMREARRLGLKVTLQFQSFYAQVAGSYTDALDRNGRPVVRVASPIMPFETATFADPALKEAYLQQVGCLARLEPEYLVLGPEVNFIRAFNTVEWERFRPVYAQAYYLVKSISPRTQVGMSYQYDGLRSDLLQNLDDWEWMRAAGPQDFIGLTSYYGYSENRNQEYPTPSTIPADYYHPIRERFDADIPIIFTEVGWSSFYPAGLDTQVLFLKRLPGLLKEARPAHVVWALLHDVQYFEGPGESLNVSGLLQRDGTPKPIWHEAQRFKEEKIITEVESKIYAPAAMPFAVTAGPARFPLEFSEELGLEAIARASEISAHTSLQFSWKDRVTGQVWDCEAMRQYAAEVRRLGRQLTIQFNTYAALPPVTPGRNPQVILLNPIVPPVLPVEDFRNQPSFSMPEIRAAYLQEMACIASLKPDYLVLGPEINFLLGFWKDEFDQFVSVYREAYQIVKSISPQTQVGVSYQYDAVREALLSGGDQSWILDVGPQDFIGLTSYFAYSEQAARRYRVATDIPADYYHPVRAMFGPNMPIVFTEVGWSTYFPRGPEHQVYFLNLLATLMQDVKPANVIWALQHDVLGYFPGEIDPLNYLGLRHFDGSPKPAWDQILRRKGEGIYISPAAVR